jgi:hypothetical protein
VIVVDTNLLEHLLLPGENTAKANGIPRKDAGWIMPLFLRSEFCNVWSTFMRRGLVTFDDANDAMQTAIDLMAGNEYEIDHL